MNDTSRPQPLIPISRCRRVLGTFVAASTFLTVSVALGAPAVAADSAAGAPAVVAAAAAEPVPIGSVRSVAPADAARRAEYERFSDAFSGALSPAEMTNRWNSWVDSRMLRDHQVTHQP